MSSDFEPPSEFDDYVNVRALGRGHMGKVYVAEDAVLARPVAIKFIANLDPDLAARQRFIMEARAAARIQHPNVVAVYRIGELGDHPYIVSELVRGTKLADVARPVPWPRVLAIATDLVRGLAAAHRRGVVHCDIKPDNVMISDDGVPKLVDFGLARVVQEGSEDAAAPIAGTPDYLAPELWRGRAPSRRSDIYSLGAVIFELLVGKPPFADVIQTELATFVQQHSAPTVLELVPDCDPHLARVVARCLERDPEQRFPGAEELREALEQIGRSRTVTSTDANPYRGLRPFESKHRGLFFGRSLEVGTIVDRLRTDSIVIVTGDSGVGKSSLCRAGVVPAVIEGALGHPYEAITMVPGRRPLAALAAALGDPSIAGRVLEDPEALPRELRRRAGDRGLLVFVDQMEELVTVGEPSEVAALDAGLARISEGMPDIRLIATVRADFLSRIAALPRLGHELSRLLFFVSPLQREQIREVITGPAAATDVTFESDEVIAALVDATARAGSGGLPLLSFALAELWEARARDRGVITKASLEAIGGVSGALARHADSVLAGLRPGERPHVRRVLLRLVTSEGTRMRRTESELSVSANTRDALDALVNGRLVVVHEEADGATYEIAHEVLVTGWGTLYNWLELDAEERARRERVAGVAAEWQRLGRPTDATLRGEQLTEARALDASNLTSLERDLIAASLGVERRRTWLRRGAIAAIIALPVGAYAIQHELAVRRLDAAVDHEAVAARESLSAAQAAAHASADTAMRAFANFDAGHPEGGELLWSQVLQQRKTADLKFREASRRAEAAYAKDPLREDVRELIGEIVFERALLADAARLPQSRDELVERLAAYDPENLYRARWAAPAHVIIHALPETRLTLHAANGATTLVAERDASVPSGAYLLDVSAPGFASIRVAFVADRDEHVQLSPTSPRAGSVPLGFVYVPRGTFFYGSDADEETRSSFFTAPPLHRRTAGPFLIGITEVTVEEWLAFVAAQPPDPTLLPNIPSKLGGALRITRNTSTWSIEMTPVQHTYTAHWTDPIVYEGREHNIRHDWRRFPITGISAHDAERYLAWLDRTGRVPGARFCTEVEWELAARGADGRPYPAGARLGPDDADIDTTYPHDLMGPDEVGRHPAGASPYGLLDVSGNANEWVRSVIVGDTYIARGGSYFHDRKTANLANRMSVPADLRDSTLGLRVCASVP